MKIKPLSNRTIRESNKTITKSNRTLVEEYSDKELRDRSFVIEDEVLEIITHITYYEIKNLIDKVGGRRSTIDKSSPCFVDRYGEVISVNDAIGKGSRAIHADYEEKMLNELYKRYGFMENDLDKRCIEDGWINDDTLTDALQLKMMECGVFRINTGTNAVENRFYCVLPARVDYRLTDSQYDTLKDFLWLSEELGRHRIIVFLGDDFHDFHLRDGFGPDEVLKEIKSYYGGHTIIDSLNEDMESDWKEIQNEIDNLTYQQVDKGMKEFRGYVNDFNGGAVYFIDRYGDIISVEEAMEHSGEDVDDIIHMDFAGLLFDELFIDRYDDWEETAEEYTTDIQDYMMDKMMSLGIIRVNTGTSDVEERCYCALPDKKDFVLNGSQYDALDKFFWWAKENKEDVQVYMGDAPTLYYAFDKEINTPDKLLNRVKQYYNGFSVKEALNEDENNPEIEKQKEQLEIAVYQIIEDYIGRNKVDAFSVKYNKERNKFNIEILLVDKITPETLDDTEEAMEEQLNAKFDGIQDGILYFYTKAKGVTGGNVNKEEIAKQYLELLDKGKAKEAERGFILPNGDLVNNGNFGENGMTHWRVDEKIINAIAWKNHLEYDDIVDAFDVNARRGDILADALGCIRVNGYNENYISLPKERPTNAQLYTLEEWIDWFFSDVYSKISVTTFSGQQQQYNDDEYTGKDVVNLIKRYYSSGTLYEALVMHWGDLDKGIKADKRMQMPGRGTGHFGTGFYFVSKDQYGDMHTDYDPSRPIYVLDTSSYKLYKPLDNNTAYKLHDALKYINDCAKGERTNFRFKQEDLEREFDDIEYETYNSDEALEKSEEECDKDFRDAVIGFVKKYEPNVSDYYIGRLSNMRPYDLEKTAKRFIEDVVSDDEKLSYAISEIADMFYVDEEDVENLVINSYNTKSEDSISTLVMKGLGYEGIDVSHLQKSGQGVMGLDDFSYGTVVYDLKPGTYERIAEPRGEKK